MEMRKRNYIEEYWLKKLSGGFPGVTLPRFKTGRKGEHRRSSFDLEIPADLSAQLKKISKGSDRALYILFFTGLNIVLHKYTGVEDLTVGILPPGEEGSDEILLCRTRITTSMIVQEVVNQVKQVVLEAFKHWDYSFAEMYRKLQIRHESSTEDIFNIAFIYDQLQNRSKSLQRFDLVFILSEINEEILLEAEYYPAQYLPETIRRFCKSIICFLDHVTGKLAAQVGEVDILSAGEKEQLLYEFNDSKAAYPLDRRIHELFEDQAGNRADNTAVIHEDKHLTYHQVNKKANQLAGVLRKKGVGQETLVPIMVERSIEMIVGIFAVLKAGAAYLPIDTEYPPARVRHILRDSAAKLLLTACNLVNKVEELGSFDVEMVYIAESAIRQQESGIREEQGRGESMYSPGSLAYVIYTSGSTGKPKGVTVDHRSAVNILFYLFETYPLTGTDRYLLKTSFVFDVSVSELFGWFWKGSTLIILREDDHKDPQKIMEKIESAQVSHINFVPSMFKFLLALINRKNIKKLSSLKYIFLAGEALKPGLVDKFKELNSEIILENLYGPTEGTVYASRYSLLSWDGMRSIPIGKPVKNIRLYILDKNNNLQPLGVSGELHISGEGVARGYLNNPELTAEKFITEFRIQNSEARMHLENSEGLASGGQLFEKSWTKTSADSNIPSFHHSIIPVAERSGAKLYRTGDLARWLPDGNIEFLGRIDHQVKIRGNRIELGEIESQLSKHGGVKDAVVTAREDGDGNQYLCAYIVAQSAERTAHSAEPVGGNLVFPPDLDREIDDVGAQGSVPSGDQIDSTELREYLSQTLPGYMIPSFFIPIENVPLTPTGKVDRKALPEPELAAGDDYVAPEDEVEKKLVKIWSEVLQIDQGVIGVEHNFFELGGHSLKGTVLISKIHREFNVSISLGEIFKFPRVKYLAQHIREAAEDTYIPIRAVEEKDYYELSYAQRRLWILCQFEEDSSAYNMPWAKVFSGRLNIDALKKALQTLVNRHGSLRTVFILVDGEPRQRIARNLECEPEQVDLRHLEGEAKEMKARRIFSESANRVFNLAKGPLFLFKIVRMQEQQYLWIANIHHIVNDGWSLGIINNEIFSLYNSFLRDGENPLQPVSLQYKDYTLWFNSLIGSSHFIECGKYWLEKLKDKPNGIELPLDHSRKPVQTFNGRRVFFVIDMEKTKKLHDLCREEDATLFMGLLNLLNIFLYKYSGQRDIIIGSPIAGRRRTELSGMIGFLVNTIVFRTDLQPTESFKEQLAKVKQETLDCYEYQDYPFDILVEQLELERDLSQSPIFNVMLAHDNADTRDTELDMQGVTITDYPYVDDFNMSKFDLIYFMDETDNQVAVKIEYNSDLFEEGTIERMSENLLTLLDNVSAYKDAPITALNCINDAEYKKLVEDFNDQKQKFPAISIQELFENQVKKNGDKDAVVYNREKLTYRKLNEQANQFAHYLQESYKVKPNDVIGISVDRSLDMIIVLLGILKSGAGYLAVDPTYPRERVLHVLGDSQSDILVIDKMRPELFKDYPGELLDINVHRDRIFSQPGKNPGCVNKPGDILYVNYTSGSTGTPNGAMLSHDCLTNLIQWQNEKTSIDCSLRVLQFTSINFCVSFQEIMGTLTSGGELHLIGDIERQDIDYLMDFLSEHQIEILFLPFSYLNFLFNESSRWNRSFKHNLKHIITAGEQLKITTGLKRFLDLNPGLQLHNHYGSTEMHVVTSYTLDASTARHTPIPPAGKPISNVNIYILDEYLNPVPIGIWGEIFVKGSSEVLGYINDEALTKKKLIKHPEFSVDGKRLYRSGDIGRWHEDGNIELRGRKDVQVKIRGFRVEPGEIESKILAIENVRECVVVVKEDNDGQKFLSAYVVVENIEVAEIWRILANELPQYMVPRIILLESLPLMPNGKVDRDKLPEPGISAADEYRAPRDIVEKKLADLWSQILGIEKESIGIHSNFFELGGHSLKATLMVSKIYKELQAEVPLTEIFRNSSLSELANYIKNRGKYSPTVIEPAEKKSYYELSFNQERIWFIQQQSPQSAAFNMPDIIELPHPADCESLKRALAELIRRHESLRTGFKTVNDEPKQYIVPAVQELPFREIDISQCSDETGKEQEWEQVFKDESLRVFDLMQVPLFHSALVKLPGEYDRLIFTMHHIISDGWSMEIFKKELFYLYESYHSGDSIKPEPMRLQYKDFSQQHNRQVIDVAVSEKSHRFWKQKVEDGIPTLALPRRIDGDSRDLKGARYRFLIPLELKENLKKLGKTYNTTLFMVMFTTYMIALSRYSNQEDIVCSIISAGREHEATYPIIGFFVNSILFKTRVNQEEGFDTFLQRVQGDVMECFLHQKYPLEKVFEEKRMRYPDIPVAFNMVNIQAAVGAVGGSSRQLRVDNSTESVDLESFAPYHDSDSYDVKFDLEPYVIEYKNGIDTQWAYKKSIFSTGTIEFFVKDYIKLLKFFTAFPQKSYKDFKAVGKKQKITLIS